MTTTTEDITLPSYSTLAEKAAEADIGDAITIDGPDEKGLKIFVESIKGRRSYRIVETEPGKGQSTRHVTERRHFKVGRDSTFLNSLVHVYNDHFGVDWVRYL